MRKEIWCLVLGTLLLPCMVFGQGKKFAADSLRAKFIITSDSTTVFLSNDITATVLETLPGTFRNIHLPKGKVFDVGTDTLIIKGKKDFNIFWNGSKITGTGAQVFIVEACSSFTMSDFIIDGKTIGGTNAIGGIINSQDFELWNCEAGNAVMGYGISASQDGYVHNFYSHDYSSTGAGHGIEIGNGSTNINISKSLFKNCAGVGVEIYISSGNSVVDSRFYNNGFGLKLLALNAAAPIPENNIFSRNIIDSCATAGIRMDLGRNNIITNNIILGKNRTSFGIQRSVGGGDSTLIAFNIIRNITNKDYGGEPSLSDSNTVFTENKFKFISGIGYDTQNNFIVTPSASTSLLQDGVRIARNAGSLGIRTIINTYGGASNLIATYNGGSGGRGGVVDIYTSDDTTATRIGRWDDQGNLGIGTAFSGFGASANSVFALQNGTAPTSSPVDKVQIYSEDVAASAELKVRDEAGNVTTLSPHNFSEIPEGKSEPMAWAFHSKNKNGAINVDMLKLARLVEKLSGEKLVYIRYKLADFDIDKFAIFNLNR
ncbi:MAG: right-handed parallel beta-helix repeat-containing protein [bacterium]